MLGDVCTGFCFGAKTDQEIRMPSGKCEVGHAPLGNDLLSTKKPS